MKDLGEAVSTSRLEPSRSHLSAFESSAQSDSTLRLIDRRTATAQEEKSTAASETPNTNTPHQSKLRLPSTERFALVLVQVMDTLLICLSGVLIYGGYLGWQFDGLPEYAAALAILVVLFFPITKRFGAYSFESLAAWPGGLGRLMGALSIVFLLLMGLAFGLKVSEQFSRVWVFSTFFLSAALIGVAHGIFMYALRHWPVAKQLRRRIAILGIGEQAERFIERLKASDKAWHHILGIFDDRLGRFGTEAFGYPILGDSNALEEWVRDGKVTDVVITLPWTADQRMAELIERLSHLPVNLLLGPDLAAYRLRGLRPCDLEGVSLFKVAVTPISDWNAILKILQDKFLALCFLILSAPLMAAIAIAIKIESPGPIFFRQKRGGFNNEQFWIHKFRTMQNRGARLNGVQQAKPEDERVTRVGWFLRRSSLDELPQLLDVLKGSMSLVGPRPHPVEHDTEYSKVISRYYTRHKVRPGITGWAQVNGWRGETPELRMMQARIEHDIYYIENWTPWLDLKILAITFVKGWYHRNAY